MANQVTIQFVLEVPEETGDQVYITGSLPEWGPWDPAVAVMEEDGAVRRYHVEVMKGTKIEYKFTQGDWSRELLEESGYVPANYQVTAEQDVTVSHVAHGFGTGGTDRADPEGLLPELTGDRWSALHPDFYRIFLFPGGKSRAVVISMDDCPVQDERLVNLLNAHGLKGSFHVNSGKLETEYHLSKEKAGSIYQGHEISCHTVTHPWLTEISKEDARKEILDDRQALTELAGDSVRGMAYPFGAVDSKSVTILREAGFAYARTVGKDDDFSLPENGLLWPGSGHQSEAVPLARRFFALPEDRMGLMLIWGHSWELDDHPAGGPNSWEAMEEFLAMAGGREDTWPATFLEVADYVAALCRVAISPDGLEIGNRSDQSLWYRPVSGGWRELKAGENTRRDE